MKREGHLIERVATWENLELAFWKAQRGKTTKPEVIAFRKRLRENLRTLRADLLSGDIEFGPYHRFQVYEPKERTISVAPFRDRVAHHALINVCEPVFERYAIYDTYACRKGKGSHAAVLRAKCFARPYRWFLKLDIAKYYETIDHGVLLQALERLFKDPILLQIFDRLIESFYTVGQPGRGIPIGNLTSQHFANSLLGGMDHWVKEGLQVPCYVRYMDDFVLWADQKQQLKQWLAQVREFVSTELHLRVKDAVLLNRSERGLPFLGYRVFPDCIRLTRASKRRYRRKFSRYERLRRTGVWSDEEAARHVEPLIAFTRFAQASGFRKNELFRAAETAAGRTDGIQTE